MTEPTIRVLSLGAGVQSTTLALLAIEGALPKPDAAIFADTGWEPARVYDHLDRLAEVLAEADIPLHRVSAGNLRSATRSMCATAVRGTRCSNWVCPARTVPAGLRCAAGPAWRSRLASAVRSTATGSGANSGTTTRTSGRTLSSSIERSARAARAACRLTGEAFLHRSRIPLDIAPIDRVTRREAAERQTDLLDAIANAEAGLDEMGDPDGCSPYGCRSGDAA